MATFTESNQVRLLLKMKLHNYSWYSGSMITSTSDGWGVVITVRKLDNSVRKIISPVLNGVSVKTEVQ